MKIYIYLLILFFFSYLGFNSLTKNEIYVTAVYADKDGVEYPVTQTITLKYSAGSKVEMPDFSSFN